jgi:hypothetical protein
MIRIFVHSGDIERGVHVLTREEHDKLLDIVEDSGEDFETVLLDTYDYETPVGEWYEGYYGGCSPVFSLDDVYVEDEQGIEVAIGFQKSTVTKEEFDLKELEGNDGDFVLIAQHYSKGGYYAEVNVEPEQFDPAKVIFNTSQYTGEYMYTDQLLESVEYDGELLDLECDGTDGKSFEVFIHNFKDVKQEG